MVLSQCKAGRQGKGDITFRAFIPLLIELTCQLSHCQVLGPTVAMECGPGRHVAIIRHVYLSTKVRELSSWYSSHIESFAQCH